MKMQLHKGGLMVAFVLWCCSLVTLAQEIMLQQEGPGTFTFSVEQEKLTLSEFEVQNATIMPWSWVDTVVVEVTAKNPPKVALQSNFDAWLKVNGFIYRYTFVEDRVRIKVPTPLPNGVIEIASLDDKVRRTVSFWDLTPGAKTKGIFILLFTLIASGVVWAMSRFKSMRTKLSVNRAEALDSNTL